MKTIASVLTAALFFTLTVYPGWSNPFRISHGSTEGADDLLNTLTLQFDDLGPHVGQLFELRVVD